VANLGEHGPAGARQRLALRAAFINRLGLADHAEIQKRIEHYISRAEALRPLILDDPKDSRQYLLLTYILAATLLAYDIKGPLMPKFRQLCLEKGVKAGANTPILTMALKAFGAYDYRSPKNRRSADKKVSRDYNAIAFALSKGIAPAGLVKFLRHHGLDACSRRLKPKSVRAKPEDWRRLARDELFVRVQPRHRGPVGSLKNGQRCVLIGTATEEGVRLDLFGCNPANVKMIIAYATKSLSPP
jgi:hypothetical protein